MVKLSVYLNRRVFVMTPLVNENKICSVEKASGSGFSDEWRLTINVCGRANLSVVFLLFWLQIAIEPLAFFTLICFIICVSM